MTGLGRVAILGTGQIGTMIGRALCRLPSEVVEEVAAWDPNPAGLEASLALGGARRALASAGDALEAQLLVLAVPVGAAVGLAEQLGPHLRPGQLLLDTGSAKRVVVAAMRKWANPQAQAIGGHPLCGGTESGPDSGEPDRLQGASFILCPVRDDPKAMAAALRVVEVLGARPVVVSAEEHDRVLARTSHLPHLTAAALAVLAETAAGSSGTRLSGSGLAGAVRLARSDPSMVASFIYANRDQVRAAAQELAAEISQLLRAAEEGEEALARELAGARKAARRLGG
ncbi:MAG: prephenate dehydrogenase [Candidatus Dormibacteria bacterium]